MGESKSLSIQLVNQLNIEYTLAHLYKERAGQERDPIIKVLYVMIANDSLNHLDLVKYAINMIGGEVPKPTLMKVSGYDPSAMKTEESLINEIDIGLEEMEAASMVHFGVLAEKFYDARYSDLFRAVQEDEAVHQKILRAIRSHRKGKTREPV